MKLKSKDLIRIQMSERLFSSLPLTVAANKRQEYDRKHGTTTHKDSDTTGRDTFPVLPTTHQEGDEEKFQLGMHISAVRRFLKDNPDVVSKDLTTSQTNRAVVRPETQGTNKPYIDKYKGCRDASGIPLVAPATVFVSHAWKYNFPSIVVAVMEQHANDEPDAYFWFDMFTNDQNAVSNKDFDWFSNTFKDSIRSIGQVLLVLSPWNDPIPLTRAWCLFEISTVLEEDDLAFLIYLPDSEVELMARAVIDDTDCLVDSLADIQAEKAQATSEDDRKMIFDVISKSKGGFQHLNNQVKRGLREWYVNQLKLLTERSSTDTNLLVSVADVAKEFGFGDLALEIAEKALKLVEDNPSAASQRGSLYNNLGIVHSSKGDETLALEYFERALKLRIQAKGEGHPSVAHTYHNMGFSFRCKGEYDKAQQCDRKALNIRIKNFGEQHYDVAMSYTNIGNVYNDKNELDKALEYYHKSLAITEEKKGEKHLDTAFLYHNIGIVHGKQGDLHKCEECNMKALVIYKATLGERHMDVVRSYNNLAGMYKLKRDLSLSMEYSHKALSILLDIHDENHPEVARCYLNLAALHGIMKEYDKSREYLDKTVTIQQNSYGEDFLESANPLMGMAVLDMEQGRSIDIIMGNITKALRIIQNILGEDNTRVAQVYTFMGECYGSRNVTDSAIDCHNKALLINTKILGVSHPDVARTMRKLDMLHQKQRDASPGQ